MFTPTASLPNYHSYGFIPAGPNSYVRCNGRCCNAEAKDRTPKPRDPDALPPGINWSRV